LTVSPTSGAGDAQPKEVHLLAEANANENPRTAYIHIKAGRLTYIVTVVQTEELSGIITASPDYIKLPYIIVPGGMYSTQIICTKTNGAPNPNASWTLTSADPWLRLSLNANATFSAASHNVSGTGNQTLYLYAEDNLAKNSKRTTIYLDASPSDVLVNVFQYGNPGTITDNDGAGTPVNNRTYVGAFWRAGEKGERLIRINVGTNNTGAWTATVMWKDARWGSDDGVLIDANLLSGPELTARGISFSTDMNPDSYGAPEKYPVTDVMATGNAGANGYIFFRIGLKSEYTPTTDHPARYAVVLLSYNNNSKHQKIFLRQGEKPDYLMMPNDPVADGSKISTRTISKKFAVYNLTAETLDTQVEKRGAIFTDYPTKAGAFWQWHVPSMSNSVLRKAFRPWEAPASSGWSANLTTTEFWDQHAEYNEVSPEGFRRPNDGNTNQNAPCTPASIVNSEFRQSLYWKVLSDFNYASELGNSIWGYYADGFFDRRRLTNGTGPGSGNTVVAGGSKDIAYIGRLYFNPIGSSERFNASLFFPAAGWLYPNINVVLMNSGTEGVYWSSSANIFESTNCGLGIIVRSDHAGMWRAEKATGATIRPVAEK
jgi:hypothetical protein